MSAYSLSKQLNISVDQAKVWIEEYFKQFPKIHQYMEDTKACAKRQGFVETLWGRRIYLPDINHRQYALRSYAERAAINAPIQGTASDIIKMAMLGVAKKLNDFSNDDIQMVLQVHDELIFQVNESQALEHQQWIQQTMQQVMQLNVDLEVSIGMGKNWHEAHA